MEWTPSDSSSSVIERLPGLDQSSFSMRRDVLRQHKSYPRVSENVKLDVLSVVSNPRNTLCSGHRHILAVGITDSERWKVPSVQNSATLRT